jgi:hypothetical protein
VKAILPNSQSTPAAEVTVDFVLHADFLPIVVLELGDSIPNCLRARDFPWTRFLPVDTSWPHGKRSKVW